MSSQSITNYLKPTEDGQHFDFWSAAFTDLHLFVRESTRIQINGETTANLPGIAAKYLGSRYYWWVLLMFNGLADAVNDIKPGVILRIPNAQDLGNYLKSRKAELDAGNYLPSVGVTTL